MRNNTKNILWAGGVVIVLFFCVLFLPRTVSLKSPASTSATLSGYATTTISAPDGNIIAQIADTPEKQTLGLGNRASMPSGTGMLFVFDVPGPQYIWMKDMEFPLDIVWIGADKHVVHIETNVSPDTYSENPPGIFYSPAPALYVLELNASDASRLGIYAGTLLKF